MKKRNIPTKNEFIKGINGFRKREKREAMYNIATFLVECFWGVPELMSDSLGVLLLTWNQAFYRYGSFDFEKLEQCINKNLEELKRMRDRSILSLSESDEKKIETLFIEFMDALRIVSGKRKGYKSPTATAKALHLLAPGFFPLWDYRIAKAYGCAYHKEPAKKYIKFMKKIKELVKVVQQYLPSFSDSGKTILKVIDEYNYSKYTKKWI